MKRLWAPWRMEYILNCRQAGCFLCDAFQSENDSENLIIKRSSACAVILNRYPYNNGHVMVAPYRHVDSVEGLRPEEQADMMAMAAMTCERLRKVMHAQGFNLGINQGVVAGAGLKDHIHLHIVPRWEGDTNFMPVLAEVKVIPQPLLELWKHLQSAFR
ncbi:MAG: HIT domain-containing protein [Kiritimatiellae bacterium]|nr:HIT domain-containing protein [Kiritimatiellia bacterium]